MLGTFVLSSGYYDAYYARAQRVRSALREEFARVFHQIDALLTPTTPEPAFELGAKLQDPVSMYLSDIFTAPANLVGIPALAVPSGVSGSGLPLSLQIMAPHFREDILFQIGGFFERETGWWRTAKDR
jgi:aspartyl-tRNA(Asn)/glutamyl-tRNA(Gln) amidotransferase subunit A